MNQEQYSCLRENRRRRGPRALGEPLRVGQVTATPLSAVVGRAARLLRRRTVAEAAWKREARPEWLAEAAVDALVGETLLVSVGSSALYYELERQRASLQKRMVAAVPGLRRLRFVVVGDAVATSRSGQRLRVEPGPGV